MQLQPHHLKFIEDFSSFGMQSGMAKSTARVLGFLLICQPQAQTAASIRGSLQLSLGSVSNALQTLKAMRIITQSAPLNKRSSYFEVKPGGLIGAVDHKIHIFQHAKVVAQSGLQNDPNNGRLAAFYNIYDVIESDLAASIAKLKPVQE